MPAPAWAAREKGVPGGDRNVPIVPAQIKIGDPDAFPGFPVAAHLVERIGDMPDVQRLIPGDEAADPVGKKDGPETLAAAGDLFYVK